MRSTENYWMLSRHRRPGHMPLYFIDTDDGDMAIIDDEGMDLPSDYAARIAALQALPDMAREKIPDGDKRTFSARVRREDQTLVYSVVLKLDGSMAES
jgi:hypothetical protein